MMMTVRMLSVLTMVLESRFSQNALRAILPRSHDFELSRGRLEGWWQGKWDERVGWGVREGHQVEVGEQHGRVRESGQGGGGWEDEGGRWGRGTGGQGRWAG